ncbi:hypothetical protein FRAHR75_270078 [Frankia sp. Hr75.2]|nr:hypothetical protein FRAHR75_270078 [Frankia sp. Hr75.2]
MCRSELLDALSTDTTACSHLRTGVRIYSPMLGATHMTVNASDAIAHRGTHPRIPPRGTPGTLTAPHTRPYRAVRTYNRSFVYTHRGTRHAASDTQSDADIEVGQVPRAGIHGERSFAEAVPPETAV